LEDTPKRLGKLKYRGREAKQDPNRLGEEGIQKILKGRINKLKGVRAVAQDLEIWKAPGNSSTLTGR
jgi:hypothetical protein